MNFKASQSIVPYLQSITDKTNNIIAYEVLARLFDATNQRVPLNLEHLSPTDWMDIDLAVAAQVLSISCTHRLPARLFINVSEATLLNEYVFESWINNIRELSQKCRITIEITEQIDDTLLGDRWSAMRNENIRLAVDDFNCEFSTYERLLSYPWDTCKFEVENSTSKLTQKALRYCVHNDIEVVVERIETQQQAIMLLHQNKILSQGFYISKPKDMREVLALIQPTASSHLQEPITKPARFLTGRATASASASVVTTPQE